MYDWRIMTGEERAATLAARKAQSYPWHRPPHPGEGGGEYDLSAACFEHAPIIGHGPQRMTDFEHALLAVLRPHLSEAFAWCILPNHYHALVETPSLKAVLHDIGQFHGRSSRLWNAEEHSQGRKVWYKCTDRAIRSERHFWATINYIHNNPVHHGYAKQWQDRPYSSANSYLDTVGREEARRIWLAYPVLDYGKSWDPAK